MLSFSLSPWSWNLLVKLQRCCFLKKLGLLLILHWEAHIFQSIGVTVFNMWLCLCWEQQAAGHPGHIMMIKQFLNGEVGQCGQRQIYKSISRLLWDHFTIRPDSKKGQQLQKKRSLFCPLFGISLIKVFTQDNVKTIIII